MPNRPTDPAGSGSSPFPASLMTPSERAHLALQKSREDLSDRCYDAVTDILRDRYPIVTTIQFDDAATTFIGALNEFIDEWIDVHDSAQRRAEVPPNDQRDIGDETLVTDE